MKRAIRAAVKFKKTPANFEEKKVTNPIKRCLDMYKKAEKLSGWDKLTFLDPTVLEAAGKGFWVAIDWIRRGE